MVTETYRGWTATWDESTFPDEEIRAFATRLAVRSLMSLTLDRVGGDPITVLPYACAPCLDGLGTLRPFVPYLDDGGVVRNYVAGRDCIRPGSRAWVGYPVGAVYRVTVDGVDLAPEDYHLEDSSYVVREQGSWPACSSDRFTVTYTPGQPVDATANRVLSLLASEFYRGATGDKKCALPSSVTSLTRQGVTMEMETGLFPGGMTGIRPVDAWIREWNPNALKVAPSVHSVDRRPRRLGVRL